MKLQNLALFNKVYANTEMYYGWELRPEFIKYANSTDLIGKKVLDLGCGEGRYSLFLAQQGCCVQSVDASPVALKKLEHIGKEQSLNIKTVESDLESYSYNENQFDIVIAATILDHLSDSLRHKTAEGIFETIKTGGIVYANVFTTLDPGYVARVKQSESEKLSISDTAMCIEHYFEPRELHSLFSTLEIFSYYEGIEPDLSHGKPHNHGWACMLARKLGKA